jgi:hypothetical protein
MTDQNDEVIIFAIDNGNDPRTRARFERHLDNLRAIGKLKRPVRLCIGMWEGELETSYEMSRADFERHVMSAGVVTHQQAILAVVDGQAIMVYRDGKRENVGAWVSTSPSEVHHHIGWTYYLDTKEYFIAAAA